ncbi:flagellar hook-basal body protein [Paenibacillus sp. FSL H8-0537]|uniref:flagellar hook-basal body protein n=1 Tax=Paenibacillus sp. FSL H8-0537 TaxID=2921399 RepID=UPI003100D4D8
MLRGLYTAAAGLTAQQRRHDTVTNNISNINTPGYKQTNAVTRSFPDTLLSMTGVQGESSKSIGRLGMGVFAEESLSLHVQGDLSQTDKPTDFALMSNIEVEGAAFDESGKYVADDGTVTFQPQAFFTLQDAQGDLRYTRGGSFTLTADGFLVNGDGANVLGADGNPIQFAAGIGLEQLSLTKDLRFVNSQTGVDSGVQPLLVTRINEPNQLVRAGDGQFRFNGDAAQAVALQETDQVEVQQGYVERSNVDAAQSSVDLMAALRAYEANQKVVQFYDQSLEKAVTEVGRV